MRVLLVEDEPRLSAQIRSALETAGFAVDAVADGLEAWHCGRNEPYDVVILDLGLPGMDGLSLLRRWRSEAVAFPVIVLTARAGWTERVEGIDAGADDYLPKPFRMEELLARVRALIRRAHGFSAAELVCGDLRLDTRFARVTLNGEAVPLTAHEFKILSYLMHHPGAVVSRTELIEHIYSQDFDRDSNTIEVFIGRLRRKLGAQRIETVRGLGYRLSSGRGADA
ncbi:MAG: response regulator transcription factor [Burkholderiales bacterium]|nr:response regulator transcription factor [Burkholderiales bacterium]